MRTEEKMSGKPDEPIVKGEEYKPPEEIVIDDRVVKAMVFYRGRGRLLLNYNHHTIGVHKPVQASLTEVDGNRNPFVGSAAMSVYNVAPRQGGVTVRVNVDWPHDLNLRLNLMW